MTYRIHPSAAAEHRRQVAFYEDKQAGLGRRYHAEFSVAVAAVCEQPRRYRLVHPPAVRRISLNVFPFDVVYREVDGDVQILAIAHHRRQPNYWLARL